VLPRFPYRLASVTQPTFRDADFLGGIFGPEFSTPMPIANDPAISKRGVCVLRRWPPHLPARGLFARGVRLAARSLARRAAVRFFAAASEAFLARADRSSGVIVSSERLPPIFPPLLPISRMICLKIARVFASMEAS